MVQDRSSVICTSSASHSLHSSPIDGQWEMLSAAFVEVDDDLFGFTDIYQEVAAFAPQVQFSAVRLNDLADDTHQSFIIGKFLEEVCAVGC